MAFPLFPPARGSAAAIALLAGLVLVPERATAQPGWEAEVKAQIAAAQAMANAATAQAQAQVAEAEARARAAGAGTGATGDQVQILQSAGSGVNSIRVIGNQAGKVVVECQGTPGAEVSINSVVADGQSLQGKTVIVTGRNTREVELRGNCKRAPGSATATNVNSVRIR